MHLIWLFLIVFLGVVVYTPLPIPVVAAENCWVRKPCSVILCKAYVQRIVKWAWWLFELPAQLVCQLLILCGAEQVSCSSCWGMHLYAVPGWAHYHEFYCILKDAGVGTPLWQLWLCDTQWTYFATGVMHASPILLKWWCVFLAVPGTMVYVKQLQYVPEYQKPMQRLHGQPCSNLAATM